MKYLIVLGVLLFSAAQVSAQISEGQEYKYTITFESNTFQGEDPRQIVKEFREHIFELSNKQFDFVTKFRTSGSICFETTYPINKSLVDSFFDSKNKTYLSFNSEFNPKSVYAFTTSK